MTAMDRMILAADRGLFAELLPPQPATLRQLLIRAGQTRDALRALQGLGDAISDADYCRADEAAFYAEKALKDHLREVHGIDRELAGLLGSFL